MGGGNEEEAESVQTLGAGSLGSMLLSCRDEWRWQMSWEGVGGVEGRLGGGCQTAVEKLRGSRMRVGGAEAGRTRRRTPSSLDLWRAKALTRLSHRGGELRDSTSGMSIGERETLSMCERTASHTTTDMSAISGSIIDKRSYSIAGTQCD